MFNVDPESRHISTYTNCNSNNKEYAFPTFPDKFKSLYINRLTMILNLIVNMIWFILKLRSSNKSSIFLNLRRCNGICDCRSTAWQRSSSSNTNLVRQSTICMDERLYHFEFHEKCEKYENIFRKWIILYINTLFDCRLNIMVSRGILNLTILDCAQTSRSIC